jgi:hypothetical protein
MGKRLCISLIAVLSLVFVPTALAHKKSVTNDCFDDHHGPNIPDAVTNIGGIDVSWVDECSNEDNYVVLRGVVPDVATMTAVGTVPANTVTFTDSTAICGVTYYYAVETSKPTFTSQTQSSAGVMISCGKQTWAPELPRRIVCAPLPIQLAMGDGIVVAGPGTLDLDHKQAGRLVDAGLVSAAFYVEGVGITCDDPAAKYGAVQVLAADRSPRWVNASGQDLGAADPGRNYLNYRTA